MAQRQVVAMLETLEMSKVSKFAVAVVVAVPAAADTVVGTVADKSSVDPFLLLSI